MNISIQNHQFGNAINFKLGRLIEKQGFLEFFMYLISISASLVILFG